MSSITIVLIAAAIIVVVAIALAVYFYYRARQTRHLRERFGPEYERLAQETGSTRLAEKRLAAREERVEKFDIRALNDEERRRFMGRWQKIQAEFVDDPRESLAHADGLLGEVMAACGYPVADFERRAGDLSVDHPLVVQHYHAAHHIALRHREGKTTTEDLRQAMIHYRALFDELVSPPPTAHAAE